MADLNLGQDTFLSEFSDRLAVDPDVASMPQIKGAGLVRDLHQASSMKTSAGYALKEKLAAFSAASTATQQKALLEGVLLARANTSSLTMRMQDRNPSQVEVEWTSISTQDQWESKLHILEALTADTSLRCPVMP